MRERITELERTLDSILQTCDADERFDGDALDALRHLQRGLRLPRAIENGTLESRDIFTAVDVEKESREDHDREGSGFDKAPLLSLFNNFIISKEEDYIEESDLQEKPDYRGNCNNEKNRAILKRLRILMPSRSPLARILQENRVSLCSFGRTFPELPGLKAFLDDADIELLLDHMIDTLQSDDATAVTKVVACLANCLQQLPWDFDGGVLGLPAPLEVLEKCFVESVETLLAPDEGIIASFEGVQCLLVQMRYHINAGALRKAWITFQRAQTFAQLLGTPQKSLTDPRLGLRVQLWTGDRILSVLLGLPYATSWCPLDMYPSAGNDSLPFPPKALFMYNLAKVAGDIIDRNLDDDVMSKSRSLAIDTELQKCVDILPSSWWSIKPGYQISEEEIHEILTFKISFYNLRNLVHLPFVLNSLASSEYQSSAQMALTSSRELIECYEIMRDEERPVLRLCNLIDFQAFIAGMIIVLILLAHHSLPFAIDRDWDILENLIQTLERTSAKMPSGVATQAFRLLRDLTKLRHADSTSKQTFHAVIPYFGKIKFRVNTQGFLHPTLGQTQGQSFPVVDAELNNLGGYSALEHTLDFDNFTQTADQQFWGVPDNEWFPMVGQSLQEDWSWDFENMDWINREEITHD
jgi:hypothetical protein